MGWIRNAAWARAGFCLSLWLVCASAYAKKPAPAPTPDLAQPGCDLAKLRQPLEDFTKIDPAKECSSLDTDKCMEVDDDRAGKSGKVPLCQLAYSELKDRVQRYFAGLEQYCNGLNAAFQDCKSLTVGSGDFYTCYAKELRKYGATEKSLSELLKKDQGEILARKLDKKIDQLRDRFIEDLSELGKRTPDASFRSACGSHWDRRDYTERLQRPGPNSIFDQLKGVHDRTQAYLNAAFRVADHHDDDVKRFDTRAKSMDDLARRMGPASQQPPNGHPDNKKSDITGTDQKPPQQQQAQGPGGGPGGGQKGGGEGGGAGGGQPSGGAPQGAAGPTAPTPDSMNPAAPKSKGGADKIGKLDGDGGSKTAKGDGPTSKPGKDSGFGSPSSFGGLSSSSAPGSTTPFTPGHGGGGGGGRSSASSGSVGGGGGGGGGGDLGAGAIGGKHCVGKDCAASGSSQFASVGSLGGGGLGDFGGSPPPPLDGAGSLDSLFKNDNKLGGPGADALGGLDAAAGSLGDGAPAIDPVNGSEEAGVAGVNGENLFDRTHHTCERAQKQGKIVGMAKRL